MWLFSIDSLLAPVPLSRRSAHVILLRSSAGFASHSFTGSPKTKTYNSEDSLVVTHPTTNSPACGLSTAERTGSPIFHTLWSYVVI
ncbi:hypothetical protein ACN38_g3584 [Penicillium nordicum]|uniref:Uncharacterized protein n=1 Tax=Penicillium nordicum TaxID=229535 RepID=A0A0M8PDJ4_9EURO|nr:hypothetical protein ACN38_g3584 [Penicillium nordicum]